MLQTNYLHDGVFFAGAYHRNVMADQQCLSSIPHNDPADGTGAIASPLQDDLGLANTLLKMLQIPVVS
jgi:hypothetical protein